METLVEMMNNFIENVSQLQSDKWSDDFLNKFNNFITKASEISQKIQANRDNATSSRKKTLSDASGSSDSVSCITDEEKITVILDSESVDESSEQPAHNKSLKVSVKAEHAKRCIVILERIDMTSPSLAIHGLDRNVDSADDIKNEFEKPSDQVSIQKHEIKSDAILKSTEQRL